MFKTHDLALVNPELGVFKKFTTTSGDPLYLRQTSIDYFTVSGSDLKLTAIRVRGDIFAHVKETVQEVINILKEK